MVNYGGDSALMFVQALNSVRFGGAILVAGLSALAIFLIAGDQADDLRTKQRDCDHAGCGRDERFIRAPFVVEGMIIGALGAIIPILFTIFGYIFIYDKLGGVLFQEMFKMTPPHPLYCSCR